MRNKRTKVSVLGVVQVLKGLDCETARVKVTELDRRFESMQLQLAKAREREDHIAIGLQSLLISMPTFDPLVFRSGVACVQAAQDASRRVQTQTSELNSELGVARDLLLRAAAGHEVLKKEYRKSVGKLARAQLQLTEYAREEAFSNRQRSSHECFKLSF